MLSTDQKTARTKREIHGWIKVGGLYKMRKRIVSRGDFFYSTSMNLRIISSYALLAAGTLFSSSSAMAGCDAHPDLCQAGSFEQPSWEKHVFDLETGLIWNVGNNTPISYRIVPTQLSWRSPAFYQKDLSNQSKFVLRHQISLLANWIEHGPEDYYLGFSAGPSLEWWSPLDKWSVYLSAGGGLGITNSTDVVGGMGQDFTLNWFAKGGLRYQIDQNIGIFGGAYFQHMSNGGQTDPNPGIDALGFTMGVSFSF